jgi:hypothetical protein
VSNPRDGHNGVAHVTRSNAETRQHRAELHRDFKARLQSELGPGDSTMRAAMVEVACSSYVEMVALTTKFLGCRATDAEMDRLSRCRLQLAGVLKSLGVAGASSSEDLSQPPRGGVADYLAQKEREQATATESIEGDDDGNSHV